MRRRVDASRHQRIEHSAWQDLQKLRMKKKCDLIFKSWPVFQLFLNFSASRQLLWKTSWKLLWQLAWKLRGNWIKIKRTKYLSGGIAVQSGAEEGAGERKEEKERTSQKKSSNPNTRGWGTRHWHWHWLCFVIFHPGWGHACGKSMQHRKQSKMK